MQKEWKGIHDLKEEDPNRSNKNSNAEDTSKLSILRLDTDGLARTHSAATQGPKVAHSPSMKANITVPKRRYSISRQDSLEQMEMPIFQADMRLRKGPSSPTTVLSMAGLFVCGILMMLSGLLVLIQQSETPFVITGSIFLATGSLMLLICLILQRKNLVKYMLDMNRDLYFLNMSDSYMWRLMFDQKQSDLPVQTQ
ncbi:unnamed protein product [Bursaphelenchus okinawaensis]|uniref:Uncharacterized protein n=1 Tax=Bursaphelenchus okinawaensis TaxID=465554 RepID=A0A811LAC8_9BILA|nr:unnamed protein product [Bursaphelenchus okinawaensis]CAG9121996.1 unnamed protein product [Bursaphelenchus okinawaensis]